MMADKKHIRESIAHYLTGAVVIMKGYEKSAHFHEHPFITIALFVLGVFIIIATIFHHWFENRVKSFKSLLHTCEFLVLSLVTYYYYSEGKLALPTVYLLAAIGHLVAAIIFYRKKLQQLK